MGPDQPLRRLRWKNRAAYYDAGGKPRRWIALGSDPATIKRRYDRLIAESAPGSGTIDAMLRDYLATAKVAHGTLRIADPLQAVRVMRDALAAQRADHLRGILERLVHEGPHRARDARHQRVAVLRDEDAEARFRGGHRRSVLLRLCIRVHPFEASNFLRIRFIDFREHLRVHPSWFRKSTRRIRPMTCHVNPPVCSRHHSSHHHHRPAHAPPRLEEGEQRADVVTAHAREHASAARSRSDHRGAVPLPAESWGDGQ